MADLILCPGCGAPVPPNAPTVFTCTFCKSTVDLRGHAGPAVPAAAPAHPLGPGPSTDEVKRFIPLFEEARKTNPVGPAVERALHAATNGRMDVRGPTHAICALAYGFKQTSGIDVTSDGTAMSRLVHGYFLAKIELLSVQETNINLPFLAANEKGPAHFETRLQKADIPRLEAH